MNYSKEELLKINGGAISWTVMGIIGGVVVFVIGLVDGFLRPLKCN